MAFEIIFKKRFVNNLIKVLAYLQNEWSDKVASDFLLKVDSRIEMLKNSPNIGIASKKVPGVRGMLITKHNMIFYKIEDKRIIVLNLYDTRSNPKKSLI